MKNIIGDREIEWGFILSNMPSGPGTALDFGPGGSTLASVAVQRGYTVTAIDLDNTDWRPQDGVTFIHGDIFRAAVPSPLDLVIACSTLEHVGIPGRYGVTSLFPDDLDAMRLLWTKMVAESIMLLTIPVGKDADFTPLCRVYGAQRLPKLLTGFRVEKEEYWIKNDGNSWTPVVREVALDEETHVSSWDPAENYYALGCFVLKIMYSG